MGSCDTGILRFSRAGHHILPSAGPQRDDCDGQGLINGVIGTWAHRLPRSSSPGFYRVPLLFWNRGLRLMNRMQKRVGDRFDVRIGYLYNSECESHAAEDYNPLVFTMISARAGESRAR
jgi:hypothetical protein